MWKAPLEPGGDTLLFRQLADKHFVHKKEVSKLLFGMEVTLELKAWKLFTITSIS